MGMSWKLDIHFGNLVLYVGTWTGDRRFNFGIRLCMSGWVGIGHFFQEVAKKLGCVCLCLTGD